MQPKVDLQQLNSCTALRDPHYPPSRKNYQVDSKINDMRYGDMIIVTASVLKFGFETFYLAGLQASDFGLRLFIFPRILYT